MKEEELKATEEKASTHRLTEIEVGTGENSAAGRAGIVAAMRESVKAWELDINAPMYIATIGRLVVRISHEKEEVELDAAEVVHYLSSLEASRSAVPALCAEVRRLRVAINTALSHLALGEDLEAERILREVST